MSAAKTQFLTTKEAARFLNCSYQALEKGRCGYGNIDPPFIRLGRAIRYDINDLMGWLERRRTSR